MPTKKTEPNIILWGVKTSPYVRKIMVALAEKNINYEHREIFPKLILDMKNELAPDDFLRASPLGKIPALQINDFYIADSAVISAYLDRQFNTGTRLYPENPEHYANTLWFERYADVTLTDIIYKKIFVESVIKPRILKQPGNEEIISQAITTHLPPMLDYLNKTITNRTWLSGKDFSMADVAVAVQMLALKTAGVPLDKNRWEKLINYIDNVISRPSFSSFIPPGFSIAG